MDPQTLTRTVLHPRNVRLRCFKRLGIFFGLPNSVRTPNLRIQASKTNKPLKGVKGVLSLDRKTFAASSGTLTCTHPKPPITIESGHHLWPTIRAMLFFVWTFIVSIPICSAMCASFPLMLWLDPFKRGVYCAMNSIWGTLSSWPFYQVEIEGRENLPTRKEAAVYVSNHQSYLDIFALLFLNRPFKFISKASIFKVPFVGWSMLFTGHIKLHRMDRRSQLQCLRDCQRLLSKGGSVLVFPEGTRSNNSEVQTFKKGAFSVAVNTGVPVVPITVSGSGNLMRKANPLEFYPGKVKIKVHPQIQSKGLDAGVLCKRVREIIASAV